MHQILNWRAKSRNMDNKTLLLLLLADKFFHKPLILRTETKNRAKSKNMYNNTLVLLLADKDLAKTILGKLNSAYVLMDLEVLESFF